MKYNHHRILAVLSAVMIVLTLVLTFNPQLFQGSVFDDILGFVNGGDLEVELASMPGDVPEAEGGDGFINGDPCGFLMGTSDVSLGGQFAMDAINDVDQACVAESGYSFENTLRESLVRHTNLGYIDFTWSSDADNHVYVDPATGYWSGVARRRGAGLAPAERWMELDWECPSGYTVAECDVFRAKTDTSTGEVSGYGWIPALGFISLEGLEMELPPRTIVAYVEVISDEDVYPGEATIKNAPLSDGYEYWRIELTFVDVLTGNILTEVDIDTLEMELTADSNVFVNQVVNAGDAIRETAFSYGEGCSDGDDYCYIEEDGEGSFNLFVYSAGPTSNMLGMDDDYDEAIENDTDRDGCKWIYESQWPAGSAPECTGIGFFGDSADYQKDDVYHVREDDRNYYTLEELSILITFSGDYVDAELFEGGRFSLDGAGEKIQGGPYIYDFEADASDETELSFRPRFQTQKFVASYDGYEYTSISTDKDQKMQLVTNSTIADFSEEYRAHTGGAAVDIGVFHQVEAESDSSDAMASDLFLLIDTDEVYNGSTDGSYADVIDDYDRDDVISNGGEATFNEDFVMGYGQTCDPCGTPPSNTLSNPTAEQWACDGVVAGHLLEFGARSCYFTAYLPILDPHDDPEAMLIIGSLNSTVEIEGFLEGAGVDDEYYSVLGSVNVATLRDKMYAQIARYTLGQSADGGDLDLSNIEYATSVVSLMGGRLLYAEGDVTVTGGEDIFSDPTTLVVRGGDVYLDENITGGRLGIVVLENNGAGGNLYVNAAVTDIYANIFLDGSMFSQGASYDDELPTWASNELRVETLANQLYLKGSLMSRNTLGGSEDGSYPKGDGTYADDYTEAIEYDLNMLRQYRLCCPTDPSTGVPDCSGASGDSESCEEGESLSGYLDEDGNEVYSSFVVEYEPAGDLPIFTVESGLFN